MKSMLVFMPFLALASASAIDSFEEAEGEERFFVTTNSGSFLTLNATTLAYGVIIGGVLLLLGALLLGDGIIGDRFRAYRRQGQADQGFYSEEQEFQTRYKRFAPNGNVAFDIFC